MSAQIWTTDQMNQMMIAETQPPDHKDAQQLKTIKRRFNWIYLLLALLGIIVIVLLILLIVLFAFYNSDRNKAKSADELSYADQAFIESRHMWQNEHCKKTCTKKFDVAPLILLSLDGFNAGYLTRNLTPSLKIIAECGAHAPFMYGSYPTKTFPNHYAIATGLYPESHGVVDNNMFDPTVKNDTKFVKTNTNPAWWFGEPIWNTVMKNGKKAACFYWPGSEVPVQGTIKGYDRRVSH
uniref:Uncharacterized protein n=1 Tax=Plectus sambesii TaxID=2011161 RepID=A0A914W4Z2_9BILA